MQTTQTFPSLPDVALPTKHLPEGEGERQLQQEQLGSIQVGKKTINPEKNPEKSSWIGCRTDTTLVRAWHVTETCSAT